MRKILACVAILVMLAVAPVFGGCKGQDYYHIYDAYVYSDYAREVAFVCEYANYAYSYYTLYINGKQLASGSFAYPNGESGNKRDGIIWCESELGGFRVRFFDQNSAQCNVIRIYDISDTKIKEALQGLVVFDLTAYFDIVNGTYKYSDNQFDIVIVFEIDGTPYCNKFSIYSQGQLRMLGQFQYRGVKYKVANDISYYLLDGYFKFQITDGKMKIYDIKDAETLAALNGLSVVLLARE